MDKVESGGQTLASEFVNYVGIIMELWWIYVGIIMELWWIYVGFMINAKHSKKF